MTTKELIQYDMMVEMDIATAEELNMVLAIVSGEAKEIMDTVVYYRTGYRTFEDLLAEDEDF